MANRAQKSVALDAARAASARAREVALDTAAQPIGQDYSVDYSALGININDTEVALANWFRELRLVDWDIVIMAQVMMPDGRANQRVFEYSLKSCTFRTAFTSNVIYLKEVSHALVQQGAVSMVVDITYRSVLGQVSNMMTVHLE
jgi:hypothetical protein